jgi:hypothetical protein
MDKTSFSNHRINKPGNGGEILLHEHRVSMTRNLALTKCLSDHKMPEISYDAPRKILLDGSRQKKDELELAIQK